MFSSFQSISAAFWASDPQMDDFLVRGTQEEYRHVPDLIASFQRANYHRPRCPLNRSLCNEVSGPFCTHSNQSEHKNRGDTKIEDHLRKKIPMNRHCDCLQWGPCCSALEPSCPTCRVNFSFCGGHMGADVGEAKLLREAWKAFDDEVILAALVSQGSKPCGTVTRSLFDSRGQQEALSMLRDAGACLSLRSLPGKQPGPLCFLEEDFYVVSGENRSKRWVAAFSRLDPATRLADLVDAEAVLLAMRLAGIHVETIERARGVLTVKTLGGSLEGLVSKEADMPLFVETAVVFGYPMWTAIARHLQFQY